MASPSNPGPCPLIGQYRKADQFDLFVAETVQMLAELLDELLEERKPKKRGRPRKSRQES